VLLTIGQAPTEQIVKCLTLFPVEHTEHKASVIFTLRSMFRDTVKSRWLGADGVCRRRPLAHGESICRVQEHL
jgi:polyphosphate kinase